MNWVDVFFVVTELIIVDATILFLLRSYKSMENERKNA